MKFLPRFQHLPLLVFGLLVYLAALVINFPAERAYLHWKASGNTLPQVALSGFSGSVWSGKADVAVIQGQRLQAVEWSLRPWALLWGQVGLGWRFQLEDGYGQGETALGLDGSVAFSKLEARLPAKLIASIAKAGVLRPSGSVSLNLEDVLWDGQSLLSANGRIAWFDAGISLFKPIKLGDLSLSLETSDDKVKGVIADNGGPLSIDGLLSLTADGSYQFSGSLAARNNKDLQRALRSMGRPGAGGKIQVSQSGNLAGLGLVSKP